MMTILRHQGLLEFRELDLPDRLGDIFESVGPANLFASERLEREKEFLCQQN
jgi:hypothetical protein